MQSISYYISLFEKITPGLNMEEIAVVTGNIPNEKFRAIC